MSDEAHMSVDDPGEPGLTPPADRVDPAADRIDPAGELAGTEPDLLPEETVEGIPVLAEARPIQPAVPAALPAVQAVAAAATGFVAGAATVALVRRHSARKLARAARNGSRRPADLLPIVGSRTFLVDVHLIGKPQE
jgi:hypothetical protein